LEDEELNLSDLDVHLRSRVIHRLELQRLVQALQQLQQQVPRQQEQEFQSLVQVLLQPLQVQVLRQQELVLQLQVQLLLLLQQLF